MKKFWSRMAALGLAAVLALGTANVPVGATSTKTDTIDTTKTTSLTIYKYDQTEYEKVDGNDVDNLAEATGEQNAAVQSALSDYAINGVTFGVIKVADIEPYYGENGITVVYQLPDSLKTALGLSNEDAAYTSYHGADILYYFTSDQINSALSDLLINNTDGKIKLEQWWNSYTASKTEGTDYYYLTTGANDTEGTVSGMATKDNLAQGLYLVIELKVPEDVYSTTDPFFVSLPMTTSDGENWLYDVYVYPKNQTNDPTIDKKVIDSDDAAEGATYLDATDVSEGDTLNYRIAVQLPEITSEATYMTKLVVTDTQDPGLSYNQDFQILWYTNEADAKNGTGTPTYTWTAGATNGTNSDTTYFTVTYPSVTTGSQAVITVTADGLAQINAKVDTDNDGNYDTYTAYSQMYMVVVYTSTVTSSADVKLGDAGNDNIATLTYSRTNTEEDEIKDLARVYTYGISGKFETNETVDDADPFKTFTDGNGQTITEESTLEELMSSVEFVLYNSTKGYYVPLTEVTSGTAGTYYVINDDDQYHAITQVDTTSGDFRTLFTSAVATYNSNNNASLNADDILNAIVFSPASDGTLRIDGLEAGTYILTEIQTASGYSLLKYSITITIVGTDVTITPGTVDSGDYVITTNNINNARQTVSSGVGSGTSMMGNGGTVSTVTTSTDSETGVTTANESATGTSTNAYAMLGIENTTSFTLPQTGGMGTILFTLAGAIVMILGVAFLTRSKRQEEEA